MIRKMKNFRMSNSWIQVLAECGEADVIIDDKIAPLLLWNGGLAQIAGSGGLSCQLINSEIKQFGENGTV
jgi:hypothetical protein